MKVRNSFLKKHKLITSLFLFALLFFSCKNADDNALIIWTNNAELLPYIELFNKTHETKKALLLYKENPARELEKKQDAVDVVIAPFLHTAKTEIFFKPLDCIFDCTSLSKRKLYRGLLSAGKIKNRTYLLPVSFNLSAFLFAKDKAALLPNEKTITLNEAKKRAIDFNEGNERFTKLGFAVQENENFLYFVAKMQNAQFKQAKEIFSWNKKNLDASVSFLADWIKTANGSAKREQDFIYKYLFMPNYKQGVAGNTLFSYAESRELFLLSESDLQAVDFRWLSDGEKILVTDDMIQVGIPKTAKHTNDAKQFLEWFFDAKVQEQFLEIEKNANRSLAIAGGFSALIETNEKSAKPYQPFFFLNPPPRNVSQAKFVLPARWNEMKNTIVLPYLSDVVSNANGVKVSLDERITNWLKGK